MANLSKLIALFTTAVFAFVVHGADPNSASSTKLSGTTKTSTATVPVESYAAQQKKLNQDAPYRPVGDWKPMFDGKSLVGWRINDFYSHGQVIIKDRQLVLEAGTPMTGVSYTNALDKIDYEVSLVVKKTKGNDFFCGLTVPVNDSFCTFIVGGWGGSLIGISCIDHMNASENETTSSETFEMNRWYHIRLRVTKQRLEGWIDDKKVVNVPITGRVISMRPGEIESAVPFGIATYETTAVVQEMKIRPVVLK